MPLGHYHLLEIPKNRKIYNNNIMDSQTLSYIAIVVSIGSTVLGIINHKRCRSNCLGRKAELSLDIDNTTPPTIKPFLQKSNG
jgi:hypothetical protein